MIIELDKNVSCPILSAFKMIAQKSSKNESKIDVHLSLAPTKQINP